MIGPLTRMMWLAPVVALLLAGCQPQRRGDELAVEPNLTAIAVTTDYASRALEATGGLPAWGRTVRLQRDGVVTFYQPDGSVYLTEHDFDIYPWSSSVRIVAREPLGRVVWQLSRGRFTVLQRDPQVDLSVMPVQGRDYAEAILHIMTAPVRFLDDSAKFVRGPSPVKLEGLWYYPLERVQLLEQEASAESKQKDVEAVEGLRSAGIQPYWSRIVLYQNPESSLVDLLWLVDVDEGKFLLVRGYDYDKLEKDGVLLPTKIEIFRTDARAISKERVVTIDLK